MTAGGLHRFPPGRHRSAEECIHGTPGCSRKDTLIPFARTGKGETQAVAPLGLVHGGNMPGATWNRPAGRVARSPVPGWDDPVPCIPLSCSPCACPCRWTHHGPFRSRCTGHRACPAEVRRGRHPRRGQRGRQGIPQDYSRGKKEGLSMTRGKGPGEMDGVSPTLLQGHSSRHPMPPGDLHGTRGQ